MAQAARRSRLELHRHHRSLAGRVLRGGLSRDRVRQQHDEIDELNATFDRAFASSRASRRTSSPTARSTTATRCSTVRLRRRLGALALLHGRREDDRARAPRARRSASHDPRPPDRPAAALARAVRDRLDAVLEKAAEVGVAVELNADPKRLDLDWRHLRRAKELRRDHRDRPRCTFHDEPRQRSQSASASRARRGSSAATSSTPAPPTTCSPSRARAVRLRQISKTVSDDAPLAKKPTPSSTRREVLRPARRALSGRALRAGLHGRRSSCWSRRSSARSAPTSA